MKTKTIKIDTAFPGDADIALINLLDDGYSIVDKSIVNERYIHYILQKKEHDPYYGKDSDSIKNL